MNTNGHEYAPLVAPQAKRLTRRPGVPECYRPAEHISGTPGLRVINACGPFIRVYSCSFAVSHLLMGKSDA
jgi:hypothetical protein